MAASLCLVLLGETGMLRAKGTGYWGRGAEELFNSTLSQSPIVTPHVPNEVNPKLIAAYTKFSFKLFSQIQKKQPDENIFISPASIAIALAITYNGASGKTQEAIAQTLELQGIAIQELNQANAALKDTLTNADSQVELSIANSFWGKDNQPFKPEFIQKIQKFYGVELKNADFTDARTISSINGWVKQSTNGNIDKIVDGIEPDTVFMLFNAIYFFGNWTYPFPKQATQERLFTLLDGTQKAHPLMFRQLYQAKYYENETFQAVSLPYGEKRLSLYVFLPRKGINLRKFYETLNAETWEVWINNINAEQNYEEQIPLLIGLPRWQLEYEIDLEDVLKNMGMEIAFRKDADFSAMTNPPLWISFIKHKTFVEVNEEGTKASAVTTVGSTRGGAVTMIVDRPFFCAIRDERTGTILFMGSIVDPMSAN